MYPIVHTDVSDQSQVSVRIEEKIISKIRARQGERTDETSLACASDYALESNWERKLVLQFHVWSPGPALYKQQQQQYSQHLVRYKITVYGGGPGDVTWNLGTSFLSQFDSNA